MTPLRFPGRVPWETMVDPRIYRALLVFVLLALIIFGFSLENQPGGATAPLVPGQFFNQTYGEMSSLARAYPDRSPGSAGDDDLAAYVRRQLSGDGGFNVASSEALVRTAQGTRVVETVTAVRPGVSNGTIVVVAHRDASGRRATAAMSGTAVLLSLARALSGETLNRSVELVSTSAQIGMGGATALAQQLRGQQVDAVIVLGNLAGAVAHNPVVVPWSGGDTLAPPALRNTLERYVTADSGLRVPESGLGGQLVRLAFPFSITEQAPFNDAGTPAVLVSLSGDRPTPADAAVAPAASGRIAELGGAILQSVDALDRAQGLPAPSSYLEISGKLVPLWAVRLLVLALILPVAASAIDALARTRRRGHSPLRWLGWVLAGVAPFLIGLMALYLARATHVLSAAPPGAVGAGAVAVTAADVAVVVLVALLVGLSFWFLRPLCLRSVRRLGDPGRPPQTPPADAAAVALILMMCGVALVMWLLNPFTALLLVPALHLWLWLAQPEVRSRPLIVVPMVIAALLPVVPIVIYYFTAYGLTPWGMIWSLVLMVAGGAMPASVTICWTFALGCLAGALVIAWQAIKAAANPPALPIASTRGPSSYAGPGSLGGTRSALRR